MRLETCPICGARALERLVDTVVFEVNGREKRIHEVPHWHCSACGEDLFDRESHRVLDPHRKRKGSRTAA